LRLAPEGLCLKPKIIEEADLVISHNVSHREKAVGKKRSDSEIGTYPEKYAMHVGKMPKPHEDWRLRAA